MCGIWKTTSSSPRVTVTVQFEYRSETIKILFLVKSYIGFVGLVKKYAQMTKLLNIFILDRKINMVFLSCMLKFHISM
jgi:hypothetical protein